MISLQTCTDLSAIPATAWQQFSGTDNPFLNHAFLAGLEQHDCLLPYGWQPVHILAYEDKQLVGALPLYVKSNSYGEFVFDWSWASAYERYGQQYYPKLVCSVPYTPATGTRFLIARHVADPVAIRQTLHAEALRLMEALRCSSLHYLFTDQSDTDFLSQQGLPLRMGCQFHWENQGYRDFQDYLDAFSSKKRKQIKRERRDAQQCGVEIEILDGHSATEEAWDAFHRFYASTFERKSGIPTLSHGFFLHIAEHMPEQVVLVMAKHQQQYVAGAFNLRGGQGLYGRHYGCDQHFRHLHFELCYYQTLDYCLAHRLARFEAGAQGEHKLSRGFLPQATWSGHFLQDARFHALIKDFCRREEESMASYIEDLAAHSPFKSDSA